MVQIHRSSLKQKPRCQKNLSHKIKKINELFLQTKAKPNQSLTEKEGNNHTPKMVIFN